MEQLAEKQSGPTAAEAPWPVTTGTASATFYRLRSDFYHGFGMAAQLNIKSEDAYRLAAELSALTGESLTTSVTAALRERLERERRARDRLARRERVTALAAELRAALRGPVRSAHAWLYDEHGLPR